VQTLLTAEQVAHDLAIRDLTDPSEGEHALQLLIDDATAALRSLWGCAVRTARGPRIVSLPDNYDRLRFPRAAITRDARYTRYVDSVHMLRSHSSAMIPPALRTLADDQCDDVLLVCPGITYRRDAIDRLHTGTPHQLDLWRIATQQLGDDDMDLMIEILTTTLAPGLPYRCEVREHPYTLSGRQVDVLADGEWIEVWECGLAHPGVLSSSGLAGYSGLALGMGLDRLLMLRKHIPDIRLLRSNEPRVVSQMLDLATYRPVSKLPSIRRDLSVAVDCHDSAEDIGDRVRDELGDDANVVEEVTVLSESAHSALPRAAIERLGMSEGQKNMLVSIVIRPLERTLSDGEANHIRDRIYDAIHQGSNHQWATASVPPEPGKSRF
jgi:phenylalanyl-tRNA synthetase alpha chain